MDVELDQLSRVVNEVFYPLFWNEDFNVILYGGAGSGKSVFAATKVVVRLLEEPGHRALLLRQTGRSIRESSYREIENAVIRMGLSELFTFYKSTCEIECYNGSKILSAGLDDPEKLKSISEIDSVWIEEATEISADAYDQVALRLRSPDCYNQIILTFNPISAMHWIKARWIGDTSIPVGKVIASPLDDTARILKTTYHHNRFIDPVYGQTLERMATANPSYYKIYVLAEWGDLRGLIYQQPEIVKDADWPSEFDERFYGIDFGFVNPTAIVEVGVRDTAVYTRQRCYRSGMLNAHIIDELRSVGVEQWEPIYCDSAEPARIQEIENAGFNARASNKDVTGGIAFCQNLHPWRVHEDSDDFLKERASYCWAEDRHGNPLDVPVKLKDHALDAFRYAAFTHLGNREQLVIDRI